MALQIHSWGRPLDQYVTSYSRDQTASRLPELDDAEQLFIGMQVIERISSASHDVTLPESLVSLSDLYTAFSFSRSSAGYSLFAAPSLIRGCIHLMSRLPLSQAGRQSPFSYEYGYLCFRLLIIAIGSCLLSRSGEELTLLANQILSNPDTEPILHFARRVMNHVAGVVNRLAFVQDNNKHYICQLGWCRCEGCPRNNEIISRSDASTLLAMIWDDDKQLMKAMLLTYSPGLSGVVYVLWRYVNYERYLQDHPSPDRFMIPFIDVFWRCVLSTTPDQTPALSLIRYWNFDSVHFWSNAPIKIRSELSDSRLMIQAYLKQITLETPPPAGGDAGFLVDDIPDALHFLHRHFVPGCEDLIPSLIGATIQWCWMTVLGNHARRPSFSRVLKSIFGWVSGLVEDLKERSATNKSIQTQALNQALNSDLVGLIGRMILSLNPLPVTSEEPDHNVKFLAECQAFFVRLKSLDAENELEEHFDAQGMGWWKYHWHLRHLSFHTDERTHRTRFYDICTKVWVAMRPSLGDFGERRVFICSYGRCPDPRILWGLEFFCQYCLRPYCSIICQQREWDSSPAKRFDGTHRVCGHPLT